MSEEDGGPGLVRFMIRTFELAFEARAGYERRIEDAKESSVEQVRCRCGGELYLLERLSVAQGRRRFRCRKCAGVFGAEVLQ